MSEPRHQNAAVDHHCDLPDTAVDSEPDLPGHRGLFGQALRVPGLVAILLVRLYQLLISPLFGRTCRFYPSCSQYYILAVRKYGLIRGSWKGTTRICRCHPWNPGGYDPP